MRPNPLLLLTPVALPLASSCKGPGDATAARPQRPALRDRVAPVVVQDVVYQIKALGPGAELQRPMVPSIVGGMVVSTALTLFVVPAAYSLLDDAVAWNERRRREGVSLVSALRAPRPGTS